MQYKWVALSNTTIGTLMASLDSNIVLIALPTIGRELPGITVLDLLWILLGYQLVTASVLVNFGRLADMFGRVRLYNFGFALFTVGSGLCSLAQSGPELIGFRMVQAFGGAFLFSNSAAIITDAFPSNERGMALGINQVSIVVGSVTGLILGGVLTTILGWRSIFWVNIPIGVFATVWSRYHLKEKGTLEGKSRIDLTGNVAFASGLSLILLGVTTDALGAVPSLESLSLIFSGIVVIVAFFFIERRVQHPMFDLSLFKLRLFSAGNSAIFLNSLARGAVTLVLVFYLQGPTMRLNPLEAGIFLIPISASLVAFGPVSGILSDRFGARGISTIGLVVSAVGFLLLAVTVSATVTFEAMAIPLILVGSGMGIFASPNRSSIMNSVPAQRRGIASGVSTTLVNVGQTLSLGLAFLIMTKTTPLSMLEQIFVGSSPSGSFSFSDFITSIHLVFYLSTAFLLVAIIPSMLRGSKSVQEHIIERVTNGFR